MGSLAIKWSSIKVFRIGKVIVRTIVYSISVLLNCNVVFFAAILSTDSISIFLPFDSRHHGERGEAVRLPDTWVNIVASLSLG